MFTSLETLGPAERAAFVLREVFETPYAEIAEAVGKSRPPDRPPGSRPRRRSAPADAGRHDRAAGGRGRFLAAIRHGDLQGLLDALAPDVVAVSDGGGLVAAARRPIEGEERVAGFLIAAARSADFEAKAVWLNGSPGGRIDIGGEVNTAVSVAVENGRITHIHAIRNPHKLARLDGVATLTRT